MNNITKLNNSSVLKSSYLTYIATNNTNPYYIGSARVKEIHEKALSSSLDAETIVKLFRLSYSELNEDLVLAEEILKINSYV